MDRRDFITDSILVSMGLLALGATGCASTDKRSLAVGVNLFSLPKMLETDFRGGIEMLSKMGYTEIQLFGPFSFSAESAKKEWDAITPMLGFTGSGYFGQSLQEFKSVLDEFNIKATASHLDLDTLQNRMPSLGEFASTLGIEYVGIPAIPEEKRTSLDDYKRIAEAFNKIGEEAKKIGLKYAYHNHGYGLQEVDGKIPLNIILEETDPDLVFFEMDIYWTAAGGANPVEYLQAYPNRYKLMHLKDMTEKVTFSGDGESPSQWVELFPYMTTLGSGVLDIKAIVETGEKAGVEHLYVEQDMVNNPRAALKSSIDYLRAL